MKSVVLICALLLGSTLAWPRIRHEQSYLEDSNMRVDDLPEMWISQKLDHFDATNTATFQQKYYINPQFWTINATSNTTGPLLLSISGEGPLGSGAVSAASGTGWYAQQIGAMMVSLEHRFYGDSLPFGANVSTEALHYLHSTQALADMVEFIDQLRANGTIWQNTSVISIGGSYAGAMSAWLKSQYPDKITGAHSSSGPVHAEQDFSAYLDVVADGLGPQCTAIIQEASAQIDELLATPAGRLNLTVPFGTCSPILTDKDAGLFMQNILGPFTALVQYNTNYRPLNITSACNMLLNATNHNITALDALAQFNTYYNTLGMPFSQPGCVQVNYTDYINNTMQQPGAGRSWTYQCCNEFGWWQTSENTHQPFSQKWNTLEWQQGQCLDVFYKEFDTPALIDATNAHYGGRTIHADNLFMANGATDPWHHESIYSEESGTLIGNNVAYKLIGPTSHCQDIGAPRSTDIPELQAVRYQIVDAMKSFLNGTNGGGGGGDDNSSDDNTVWIITVCVIGGLAVLMLLICVGWRMRQTRKAHGGEDESDYAHLNA